MKIKKYEYEGEGLVRVFENEKWTVGIKNWKPANDIANTASLERHNQTDELFVLLAGSCVLLFANEVNGKLEIEAEKMEPGRVYDIPPTLWHNTVTRKDTKLILIEDSSTGSKNSDVLNLSAEQIARVKKLAGG
jgi:mannose-6-phosphate isomerase-like protein (cupin superfamily)